MRSHFCPQRVLFLSFAAIIAAGLMYFISCSEKSTVEPEPPEEEYILAGSDTIGAGGGTLTAGDLMLTIPAGAFSSDRLMKVYASSSDVRWGGDQVSKTYRLEGVSGYSVPLQVSVRYEGALQNSNFIGLGAEGIDPAWNDTGPTYSLLEASVNAGRMESELPVASSALTNNEQSIQVLDNSGDDPLGTIMFLFGITNQLKTIVDGPQPFKIVYPANLLNKSDDIVDVIDNCWQTLHAGTGSFYRLPVCGGPWSQNDTAIVLVRASMNDSRPGGIGRPIVARDNRHIYYLWLNADKVAVWDKRQLAIETISLYWLLAQTWNDEQFAEGKRLWFHMAFSLWSQSLFSVTPPHYPELFRNHELVPLRGPRILTNDSDTGWEYGCGMTPLARYLANKCTKTVLQNMCGEFCNADKTGFDVILEHYSSVTSDWFPEFISMYIRGSLYSVEESTFLSNLSGSFVISSAEDTQHIFSQAFNDLSAKLFMVSLNYPDIDQNATIQFIGKTREGSDRTVLVFGRKPSGLVLLAEGHDVKLAKSIRTLMNEGYSELVAAVVNHDYTLPNFSGETTIDLTVSVDTPPQELPYIYCTVEVFVEAQYENSVPHTYWSTATLPIDGPGSFTGNDFTGTWNYTDDFGYLHKGHVTLVLDPDAHTVTTFEIADTMTLDDDKIILEANGQNLPETDAAYNYLEFSETGLIIDTRLTHFYWRSEDSDSWSHIIDYRASEYSTLFIYLTTYIPLQNQTRTQSHLPRP